MRSSKFSLNAFDIYSAARDVFLFLIAALVATLPLVEQQLKAWNFNQLLAALIVWTILELSRRFCTNYINSEPTE